MLIIFVVAVLTSIIFERQERRHQFFESLEYRRMGREMPRPQPKQPKLESWMGFVVGCYVFLIGISMVVTELWMIRYHHDLIDTHLSGNTLIEGGATTSAGIAIMILSFRLIRQHHRSAKTT